MNGSHFQVPAGQGENRFAYGGKVQERGLAEEVVTYLHQEWKEMMLNCSIGEDEQFGSFSTMNTQVSRTL